MPTHRIENDNPAPSRFTKDAMKRTKRLSIEFQHREVTVTFEGSTLHVPDSAMGIPNTLTVCPSCGSPWIPIAARMGNDAPANTDRIHRVLERSGLHMQVSPAGQLQICRRSFEEIKENL